MSQPMVWRPDFPQAALAEGFQWRRMDTALQFQSDAGPGRVRRQFTEIPKAGSFTFSFPTDKVAAFFHFFEEDLGSGTVKVLLPIKGEPAPVAVYLRNVRQAAGQPGFVKISFGAITH